MARRGSSSAAGSAAGWGSVIGSAIVGVDRIEVVQLVARAAQPHDLDVAEGAGLVELDEALLEELEHGEEAHDDVEPLHEAAGELTEADRADEGQLLEELRDGLAHRCPD